MDSRCRAHSTRTGERCKKRPVRGAAVCATHGGAAPQVKDKARERLAILVLPAIAALAKLIDQADSDSVRLSAIKDVLDRCGYKVPEKLETSGETVIRIEFEDKPLPATTAQKAQNGHVARF